MMKPVQIQQLAVRRAPGFAAGMKPLVNLDAPVVIISGTNGSGKSTTARILQQALACDSRNDTEYECSFTVNGALWSLSKSAGQTRWTCNGEQASPDFLLASTQQSRYMLAMHDLLLSEDGDLAKNIYKASIGGFNIDLAAKKLNYSGVGSNAKSTEFNAYNEVEKRALESKQYQENVKKRQSNLTVLEQKKKAGIAARSSREFYNQLLQLHSKKTELRLAKATLETFPPELERINADDADRYSETTRQIEELSRQIDTAESEAQSMQAALERLHIADSADLDGDLNLLKELRSALERNEREHAQIEEQLKEKQATIKQLKTYVGDVSVQEAAPDLNDIENAYRKCLTAEEQRNGAHARIEQLRSELGNLQDPQRMRDSQEPLPRVSDLQQGIVALSGWLREPRQDDKAPADWWRWALAALVLVAGVSGWLFGPFVALFIAVGAFALAWLSARTASQSKDEPTEDHRKQDYQRSGLPQPQSWSVSDVGSQLNTLLDILHKASLMQSRVEQLKSAELELSRLNAATDGARIALQKLGESCGASTSELQDAGSLYQYMRYYVDLRKVSAELAGMAARKTTLSEAASRHTSNLASLFSTYNLVVASPTPEHYFATIDTLIAKIGTYQKIFSDLRHKNDVIHQLKAQRDQREQETQRMLSRIGITVEQASQLRERSAQKEAFLTTKESCTLLDREVQQRSDAVMSHSYMQEIEQDPETLHPDDIHQKISDFDELLSGHEAVLQEIGGITNEVQKILGSYDLEIALTRAEEARQRIQIAYESKARCVVGDVLVKELQKELGTSSVPEVMRVSQQLFSKITNGRYELRLSETPGGGFKAYDNNTRQFRALNELSSGTRIQLLLSVRLAFMEVQEHDVKFPLFADELLANSDDLRAEAVIDTLLEVARNGRQVFYFTAQSDEIAKWEHKFDDDIRFQSIQLDTQIRGRFSSTKTFSTPPIKRDLPKVSLPYVEYLRELNVPVYNVVFDTTENLHLAFILTEVPVLHALLERHIDYWSQLQSLQDSGNRPDCIDEQTMKHLHMQVMAIEHASQLLQKGRNKPVGYQDIKESNAVSDSFMEQVLQVLSNDCENDPARLIIALNNKIVPRFSRPKIVELEEFFKEREFIANEEPLSEDAYKQGMSTWLHRNEISSDVFDTLMNRFSTQFKLNQP